MLTFKLNKQETKPRVIPKTGDLFINTLGDLCMVRIPGGDGELGQFTGVPYAHLTGPQTREGRYYMERSAFDVCTLVELSEPMQLREVQHGA